MKFGKRPCRRRGEGGSEIRPAACQKSSSGGEGGSEIPPYFGNVVVANWGSALCVFSKVTPPIVITNTLLYSTQIFLVAVFERTSLVSGL